MKQGLISFRATTHRRSPSPQAAARGPPQDQYKDLGFHRRWIGAVRSISRSVCGADGGVIFYDFLAARSPQPCHPLRYRFGRVDNPPSPTRVIDRPIPSPARRRREGTSKPLTTWVIRPYSRRRMDETLHILRRSDRDTFERTTP